MHTVHYRRWCPPQSPLRIEFPPELLRDVRLERPLPARALPLRWIPRFNRVVNQSSVLLFGVRHEDEVRVLAASADEASPDGLASDCYFERRGPGAVFPSDKSLATFEVHQALRPLVDQCRQE